MAPLIRACANGSPCRCAHIANLQARGQVVQVDAPEPTHTYPAILNPDIPPQPLRPPSLRSAFHEAGHAVACTVLLCGVDVVVAGKDANGTAWTWPAACPAPDDPAGVREWTLSKALYTFAGWATDRYRHERKWEGALVDLGYFYEDVARLVPRCVSDDVAQMLDNLAAEFVRDASPAIGRVASALLEPPWRLKGPAVRDLIGRDGAWLDWLYRGQLSALAGGIEHVSLIR
jgi:hypothetical protein